MMILLAEIIIYKDDFVLLKRDGSRVICHLMCGKEVMFLGCESCEALVVRAL